MLVYFVYISISISQPNLYRKSWSNLSQDGRNDEAEVTSSQSDPPLQTFQISDIANKSKEIPKRIEI